MAHEGEHTGSTPMFAIFLLRCALGRRRRRRRCSVVLLVPLLALCRRWRSDSTWPPPFLHIALKCCSMYSLFLIPYTLWRLGGGGSDEAEVRPRRLRLRLRIEAQGEPGCIVTAFPCCRGYRLPALRPPAACPLLWPLPACCSLLGHEPVHCALSARSASRHGTARKAATRRGGAGPSAFAPPSPAA